MQTLKSFGDPITAMSASRDGVILGSDGDIYGAGDQGVFRLARDGTGLKVLHRFNRASGAFPGTGIILEGMDGLLYGAAYGALYRIDREGRQFQVLTNYAVDSLNELRDGRLCVVGDNAVFTLNKDGTGLRLLHQFGQTPDTMGSAPVWGVLQARDGTLYGVTARGGDGWGILYKLAPDGTGFTVLHRFAAASDGDSWHPYGLTEATDGTLWGTTQNGGLTTKGIFGTLGTIFHYRPQDDVFKVMHRFGNLDDSDFATRPNGPLVLAPDGKLYGLAQTYGNRGSGAIYRIDPVDGGYAIVRVFPIIDGYANPDGDIAVTPEGMLLATMTTGGQHRSGRIVEVDPHRAESLRVLFDFHPTGPGLAWPHDLIEGPDGMLYGLARTDDPSESFEGDVKLFQIRRDGSGYEEVYRFPFDCCGSLTLLPKAWGGSFQVFQSDGRLFPFSITNGVATVVPIEMNLNNVWDGGFESVIKASDGRFYGVMNYWDVGQPMLRFIKSNQDRVAFEEILRLPDLTHTANGVSSFQRQSNVTLLEGVDGLLYGATDSGAVFKLKKDGTGFALLRSSDPIMENHAHTTPALIEGSDGVLYGTYYQDGAEFRGVLYRIERDGAGFRILWRFYQEARPIAHFVDARIFEGRDGALYGVFSGRDGFIMFPVDGGNSFRIQKDGSGYTLLKQFHRPLFRLGSIQASPPSLIQASDGAFYGTTQTGGEANAGTVFRFSLPAELTVIAQPQDTRAPSGGSAAFSVVASGRPPHAYQWRLDGSPLPGATNTFLNLTNLTSNQAGSYDVVITNLDGTITSRPARLGVQPPLRLNVEFNVNRTMLHFTVLAVDGSLLTEADAQGWSVQWSSNLTDWRWAFDFQWAEGQLNATTPFESGTSHRYYRLQRF